jgi:hypothetical protein
MNPYLLYNLYKEFGVITAEGTILSLNFSDINLHVTDLCLWFSYGDYIMKAGFNYVKDRNKFIEDYPQLEIEGVIYRTLPDCQYRICLEPV